jgi:hypothetical protein
MGYMITIMGSWASISAPNAAEAVRRGKALEALGRAVTLCGPEGEAVNLQMLELAVRRNKLDYGVQGQTHPSDALGGADSRQDRDDV